MTTLYLPDGTPVLQGSIKDMTTWWCCTKCGFTGPNVGTNTFGNRLCLGIICGGTIKNPNVPRLKKVL